MATIASMAVQLSVNAAKFEHQMRAATKTVAMFGLANRKFLNPNTLIGGINKGVGSVSKFINDALTPTKAPLSSIPLIGRAFEQIPTSISGVFSMVEKTIGEMSSMVMSAKRLGVTIETLGGIQLIAGSHAEQMERAMFHLARTLGEANAGSTAAAQTLERLGFAADSFKGSTIDQSLKAVMDKFQALRDPMQKAYLAQQLFGRTGVELVPILSRGSKALDEAAKRARRLGISFSELEAGGILQAKRSLKQIDQVVEG